MGIALALLFLLTLFKCNVHRDVLRAEYSELRTLAVDSPNCCTCVLVHAIVELLWKKAGAAAASA